MEVERATCVAPATCVALPGGVDFQKLKWCGRQHLITLLWINGINMPKLFKKFTGAYKLVDQIIIRLKTRTNSKRICTAQNWCRPFNFMSIFRESRFLGFSFCFNWVPARLFNTPHGARNRSHQTVGNWLVIVMWTQIGLGRYCSLLGIDPLTKVQKVPDAYFN